MTAFMRYAIETIRQRAEEALNDDAIMVPIVELTAMARDVLALLAALSAVEADLRRKEEALRETNLRVGTVLMALDFIPVGRTNFHTICERELRETDSITKATLAPVSPSEPVPQPETPVEWADLRPGDAISLMVFDHQFGWERSHRSVLAVDGTVIRLRDGEREYDFDYDEPERYRRDLRRSEPVPQQAEETLITYEDRCPECGGTGRVDEPDPLLISEQQAEDVPS